MSDERNDSATEGVEAAVRGCYSTWGETYYDEYYGPDAPYPPVHLDLVKSLVERVRARRILDAGCGPASMMRHLVQPGADLHGFDLTPEMVREARVVLGAQGLAEDRVWQGSVLDPAAFSARTDGRADFDCVLSCGVLPHIPAAHDRTVIDNMKAGLRAGGYALVEARNELFSLFTMNRYSHAFFLERLIGAQTLRAQAGAESAELERALGEIERMFRTDVPPLRKGKASEPGYDEVLSRTHNPLLLREQFQEAGFVDVQLFFYHFHSLPPLAGALVPRLFRRSSLEMERDPEDWRGLFMASAFFVLARRP
jgi:SAM-dependent methyltransferase